MSKSEILGRVRDSLKANTHIPSPKVHYANPMNYTHAELLEEYKLNQTNNKAIVRESSVDSLESTIEQILKEVQAKQVLYNTDVKLELTGVESKLIPYTQSVDLAREELFGIDTIHIMFYYIGRLNPWNISIPIFLNRRFRSKRRMRSARSRGSGFCTDSRTCRGDNNFRQSFQICADTRIYKTKESGK